MTLHRWYEGECGSGNQYSSWMIERDETTGKPYRYSQHAITLATRREPIPDRERGALKRIAAIVATLPGASFEVQGASFEVQGDPRGWPLTITLQDGRALCPPLRY